MGDRKDDSLLDLFIFETLQSTDRLEKIILETGESDKFPDSAINEIFRIMHTVKGSAAMMSYAHISSLAHKTEDLFYFIRENPSADYDIAVVSDFVLSFADYINSELDGIRESKDADTMRSESLCRAIEDYLTRVKSLSQNEALQGQEETERNRFKAVLFFDEGCEMENIRAYGIVLDMSEYAKVISYIPEDIDEGDSGTEEIRKNGFTVYFESDKSYDELLRRFVQTPFIRDVDLSLADTEDRSDGSHTDINPIIPIDIILHLEDLSKPDNGMSGNADMPAAAVGAEVKTAAAQENPAATVRENPETEAQKPDAQGTLRNGMHQPVQSIISVSVSKLDKLMNLVGELVIAESMIVENPDLKGLELQSFKRAASRLHKIIGEMQDQVMSMRLVPLVTTFQKTNRIVRDMSRKLGKEVRLNFIGEETEVDKNVIEHISNPLLHLVRNSLDHGIESREERIAAGKPGIGTVSVEAYSFSSYVYITVSDDGRGLNKEKILNKAIKNNLLKKPPESMTDREIYSLIFLPGFSTSDTVTEYSGRGVGMDVVMQNIISIGGAVSVDSMPGKGTSVIMKIPLTIAIIDGMNIAVGDSRFTIPVSAIKETFKPGINSVFKDSDGNEMIMVRGECYAIVRLSKEWNIETNVTELADGILVLVEQDEKRRCIFADSIIGKQQVVVKSMPELLKKAKLAEGFSGCTLLGDGSISLIFDINWLVNSDIR
jgi:two-component system chemotaxis sensor kinase CheA